jgi:hypothetical protein
MLIGRIPGATRVVGKHQGYLGLPLRDEPVHDAVNGKDTPSMVTAWLPTPKEQQKLAAGEAVYVRILGNVPPPMMVSVGDAPPQPQPDELLKAILTAEAILEGCSCDPHTPMAVLARAFLRTIGKI